MLSGYFEQFQYAHWSQIVEMVMKNAGYILSNQIEVFNNTEVLKEAFVPSLPWGQVITKANMQKNQLLLKTCFILTKVVQEDLSDERNPFGVL